MPWARANDLSNSMCSPDGNANRADVGREGWDGGVLWGGEGCVWTHFLWFLPLGCTREDFAVVSEVLQRTLSLGGSCLYSFLVSDNST